MATIHDIGFLHRDLKPQNILIDPSKMNVRIADFGLCQSFIIGNKEELSNKVITLWYRPLELLLGCNHYDTSIDSWSCG